MVIDILKPAVQPPFNSYGEKVKITYRKQAVHHVITSQVLKQKTQLDKNSIFI